MLKERDEETIFALYLTKRLIPITQRSRTQKKTACTKQETGSSLKNYQQPHRIRYPNNLEIRKLK